MVGISLGMALEDMKATDVVIQQQSSLLSYLINVVALASPWLAFLIPYLVVSSWNLLVLTNAVLCILVNVGLVFKSVFFGALANHELRNFTGRCVGYGFLKIVFMAAVGLDSTIELCFWTIWFLVVGFVKVFSGLARDKLDSLVATLSASNLDYGKNLAFVLMMMAADVICARHLSSIMENESLSMRLLFMFEPVLIMIDLSYTLLRSCVNLAEQWHLSHLSNATSSSTSSSSSSSSTWQWFKVTSFLYYVDFTAAMLTRFLTLVHYSHVWFHHGFHHFQVVDTILLFNVRSLISSMHKRVKTFMEFHCATSNLNKAFPDATKEEIETYGDCCAICKDSLSSAKVLPCGHMFHLSCLRSWLEQGEHGNYTCPLCRHSLTNTAMKGDPSQQEEIGLVHRFTQRATEYGNLAYSHVGRPLEGFLNRSLDYIFREILGLHPRYLDHQNQNNNNQDNAAAAAENAQAAGEGRRGDQQPGLHSHGMSERGENVGELRRRDRHAPPASRMPFTSSPNRSQNNPRADSSSSSSPLGYLHHPHQHQYQHRQHHSSPPMWVLGSNLVWSPSPTRGTAASAAASPAVATRRGRTTTTGAGGFAGFSDWLFSGRQRHAERGASGDRHSSNDDNNINSGSDSGGLFGTPTRTNQMEGWIQIVRSILPHVPTSVIARDLERTRNVNVTVNNLLGS
jgi:hypothetical protein